MVVLTETCSRKITSLFVPLQPVVTAVSLAGFPYEILLLLILNTKIFQLPTTSIIPKKKN